MASIKEIRTHIKSVEETLKITNAMYLISSSNLRKARKQLGEVEPYFRKIDITISDILHHSPEIRHKFFDQRTHIPAAERKVGYLVITGDKGLAGAYNHNVLQLAEGHMKSTAKPVLFLVGQVGRAYFKERDISIDKELRYMAQNPNIGRARDISECLLRLYEKGELDEVYVVFTNMVNSIQLEPTVRKVLPLDKNVFPWEERETGGYSQDVAYIPTVDAVMDHLVPGYLKGVLFGALVESYCSEQNARMTAMKSSSDNARAMLQNLNLTYNRARQTAITQEITEIVAGAQSTC